uniref:Uncharacterized protein n=1 Tax=Anguilla anguilla TaxID=7936 RepID=A0A0E9S7V6_ANGAN
MMKLCLYFSLHPQSYRRRMLTAQYRVYKSAQLKPLITLTRTQTLYFKKGSSRTGCN